MFKSRINPLIFELFIRLKLRKCVHFFSADTFQYDSSFCVVRTKVVRSAVSTLYVLICTCVEFIACRCITWERRGEKRKAARPPPFGVFLFRWGDGSLRPRWTPLHLHHSKSPDADTLDIMTRRRHLPRPLAATHTPKHSQTPIKNKRTKNNAWELNWRAKGHAKCFLKKYPIGHLGFCKSSSEVGICEL